MFIIMDVREENFSEKTLFSQGERLMKNITEGSSSYLFLIMTLVFRINSFSMIKEKLGWIEREIDQAGPFCLMVYSFVYFSLVIVAFRISTSLIPF